MESCQDLEVIPHMVLAALWTTRRAPGLWPLGFYMDIQKWSGWSCQLVLKMVVVFSPEGGPFSERFHLASELLGQGSKSLAHPRRMAIGDTKAVDIAGAWWNLILDNYFQQMSSDKSDFQIDSELNKFEFYICMRINFVALLFVWKHTYFSPNFNQKPRWRFGFGIPGNAPKTRSWSEAGG